MERFELQLPPDPAALGSLRRAVHEWLTDLGIVDADVAPIVAACSEIAADAIESGKVGLDGLLADSDVVVRCTGSGDWRIEDHPSRYVAALLVDDLSIERTGETVSVVLRKAASRGLR